MQPTLRIYLPNAFAVRDFGTHVRRMGPLSRPGRTQFGRDNGPNLLWLWLCRLRLEAVKKPGLSISACASLGNKNSVPLEFFGELVV